MVYGAINERGEQWYTRMSRVFEAIRRRQLHYNWLISDIDCVPRNVEERCCSSRYCWLTGEELTHCIEEDDGQWVWAVLSGFSPDISLSDILRYPLPYADGYPGFWTSPLSMQHPLASIEIVPWDSSLTLLFSTQAELVEDFLGFFPFSEELSAYIARQERT